MSDMWRSVDNEEDIISLDNYEEIKQLLTIDA